MSLLPLVLLTLVPAPQSPARTTDPIAERLAKVRAESSAVSAKARGEMIAALDALRDATTEKALRDRIATEREAFEKLGVLPATVPAESRKFEEARLRAAITLQVAYQKAIASYGDSSQHDVATHLKDDLARHQEQVELLRWRDLRCQIDLARHDKTGAWAWHGTSLLSDGKTRGILRLPMSAAEISSGYLLRLDVERISGVGDLQFLFSRPTVPSPDRGLLVLAGWGGETSGLERIDGAPANNNDTTRKQVVFSPGKVSTVIFSCNSDRILVTVNDRPLIRWGFSPTLSLPDGLARDFFDVESMFLIASGSATFRIDNILLQPTASDSKPPRNTRPRPTAASVKVATDVLGMGSVWSGKNKAGITGSAKVVQRNRLANTAIIEIGIQGRGKWRVALKTSGDGSTFSVSNIRRVDQKVGISNESGDGHATSRTFVLTYAWTFDRPGHHGQASDRFTGSK